MSSSPQLAGTTWRYPASAHACANRIGVAGNAAKSASAPRTTIDGMRIEFVGALSGAANVMEPRASFRRAYASTYIDHSSMSVRPHARGLENAAKQDRNSDLSRAAQTLQPAIPLAGREGWLWMRR